MNLKEICKLADHIESSGILFNSDCFDVMKKLDNNSIDFIITDPPYLFNKGHGNKIGAEGSSKIANSELYNVNGFTMKTMGEFGKDKIYNLLDESKRICKVMKGYYFCNETALQYYLTWATENNCNFNIIVLEKQPFIMNRNKYATNCEFMIRIIAKAKAGINVLEYKEDEDNNIEWLYSVQKFNKVSNKLHPAQKPQDIIKGVLKLNTKEGDVVFDPFSGSGIIPYLCKNMGRKFIACELETKFFDIIKDRLKGEHNEKCNS